MADDSRAGNPAGRLLIFIEELKTTTGSTVDAWLEGATAPITRALERLSPEERATFVVTIQAP